MSRLEKSGHILFLIAALFGFGQLKLTNYTKISPKLELMALIYAIYPL